MTEPTIHINNPQPVAARLHTMTCHNCKRQRWFASFFIDWYGWDSTCLHCGDAWADGEWLLRPFKPRWRQESIASAKKRFRRIRAAGIGKEIPIPTP